MNILKKDEYNKDIILDPTQSHQIMMEWEKSYMEECIQKLQPFGDVLEIGFGLGYSATEIQKFPIKSYTVIECDESTYRRALKWKEKYNHPINVVFGRWEDMYKTLPKFDCLFFDDYDINNIKLYKNSSSVRCRNINFIETIKNNLKEYVKFSFYCAINSEDILEYKDQWSLVLKNFHKKIDFKEYKTSVPENCKYIAEETLYCSLIEMKKTFNYY